jgi:RNA polymerase sigma-54 factor
MDEPRSGSREIEQTLDTGQRISDEPAEAAARTAQDAKPRRRPIPNGACSGASDDDKYNLEAFVAAEITLGDHLAEQIGGGDHRSGSQRMIGQYLIDLVDEAGYLPPISDRRRAARRPRSDVEAVLAVLQKFDPPGVCARNLSECLAIQLRELNRYDPAMQALVEHLDLLAKRDLAALRKLVRRR